MPEKQEYKDNKEQRLTNISEFTIERREESDGKMIIEGYAAVFDREAQIGRGEYGFIETIAPGAFDGANMRDVPLKYNHDSAIPILARTRNKSLVLTVDDVGLKIRAELLDTTDGTDMYKRIKAGLIDKMSFAFSVRKQEFTYDTVPRRRKILQFERIYDVSVVDTPAYDDTSIYARSLELADAEYKRLEGERAAKPKTIEEIRKEILIKQYRGN